MNYSIQPKIWQIPRLYDIIIIGAEALRAPEKNSGAEGARDGSGCRPSKDLRAETYSAGER